MQLQSITLSTCIEVYLNSYSSRQSSFIYLSNSKILEFTFWFEDRSSNKKNIFLPFHVRITKIHVLGVFCIATW